ncbi:hypothetical protein Goklo_007990 [Gossypium klotzschianum]|uniref:Rhodanese domain-containing protein n=1 Tax=Gossypium klotzschianum TaxID=34286 RepID=A0A7J8UYY2_9ROSI|nr:hypothetical protein [Gossypium klotzschianum]
MSSPPCQSLCIYLRTLPTDYSTAKPFVASIPLSFHLIFHRLPNHPFTFKTNPPFYIPMQLPLVHIPTMEATSLLSSSSSFTLSFLPSPLSSPHLHHRSLFFRGMFPVTVNPQTYSTAVVRRKLSFCTKAVLGGNVHATGVPTSVPVRVAHELHQAGHRYLDVRTPEEFSAGHVPGAINIPYMYKVGPGMAKNPSFVAEVSSHLGKYDEIIVVGVSTWETVSDGSHRASSCCENIKFIIFQSTCRRRIKANYNLCTINSFCRALLQLLTLPEGTRRGLRMGFQRNDDDDVGGRE